MNPTTSGRRPPARSYQRPARGATSTIGTVVGMRARPASAGLMPRLTISSSGKITPSPISAIPAKSWLSEAPKRHRGRQATIAQAPAKSTVPSQVVAMAQQLEVHERQRRPALADHEPDHRERRDRERAQHDGSGPAPLLGLRQAENEPDEDDAEQQRAADVG